MANTTKAKGGKKNRKYGRNVAFCLRYEGERRRERNKKRTLLRHAMRHPQDDVAFNTLRTMGVHPTALAELHRKATLKRMDKDERYYANWRRREMKGVNMRQAEQEIAAFMYAGSSAIRQVG